VSRELLCLAVIALAIGACGGSSAPDETDGTWVGTITTEGNVTTVFNESGSVWGGTATLVEEASIGVESGADEYMFGMINAIYVTDERIYVVDGQVPALRVFDHDGNFIRNLGREGQGPGEFTSPSLVAADADGRLFLFDSRQGRIDVYGADGENLDPWPFTTSRCCVWPMYPLTGEAVWAPVQEWNEDHTERRFGLQAVGPTGPYGEVTWIPEIDYQRTTFEVEDGFDAVTPFSAWLVWAPAPYGGLLVGASDRYRFEIHQRDGSSTVVERYWEPVPVSPEEKEWERQRTLAFHRALNNPEADWDGAEIPDHKPAYGSLLPTFSGEVWVSRRGRSRRLPDCAESPLAEGHPAGYERPCWADEGAVDVFGADGRYRGEVDVPDEIRLDPMWTSIDGLRVVAVVQDDAGTYKVKRYRLELPAEQ